MAELSAFSEGLALGDLEDGWGEEVPVPTGEYRLRISARGRTESAVRESSFPDNDSSEEIVEPLECYLLELWPASAAPAVVIGETSRRVDDSVARRWSVRGKGISD